MTPSDEGKIPKPKNKTIIKMTLWFTRGKRQTHLEARSERSCTFSSDALPAQVECDERKVAEREDLAQRPGSSGLELSSAGLLLQPEGDDGAGRGAEGVSEAGGAVGTELGVLEVDLGQGGVVGVEATEDRVGGVGPGHGVVCVFLGPAAEPDEDFQATPSDDAEVPQRSWVVEGAGVEEDDPAGVVVHGVAVHGVGGLGSL